MARVKTFTNGGSLLPGDLNSIEDDYEFAFSTWKTITRAAKTHSATGVGKYAYSHAQGSAIADASADFNVSPGSHRQCVQVTPADFTANTRAVKLQMKVTYVVNAVAPAITFTWALTGTTVSYGASGSSSTYTFGADVAGSALALATPAANSGPTVVTSEFTAPAAANYLITVNLSGNMAAGSVLNAIVELQQRQV